MQLQNAISQSISQALHALFGITVDASDIALQPTRKEFAGSFTFVTFPYTKQVGKGPEQIGQALGEYLKEHAKEVKNFNVVKGFLNLEVEESEWLRLFRGIMANPQYGYAEPSGRNVMV
ncbi:MAG: arginine--tRNA ligase, partial [Pontibacter sp.]|nr:arginine--tRNA ligase [Pontibacter sp.]